MKRLISILLAVSAIASSAADFENLHFDPVAAIEGIPLALECLAINERANERMAKHDAELAAKGVAEVPASNAAVKYKLNTGGLADFLFDDWGELYIDRRFVTDEEMKTIEKMEAFAWKHLIGPLQEAEVLPTLNVPAGAKPRAAAIKPKPSRSPAVAAGRRKARSVAGKSNLPIFRGFEDARYQKYDSLIAKLVNEFNADKAKACGGSNGQASKINDLTPALVKAHMIEETGGNGKSSLAAWAVDPLQVNVPGDWGKEKELVGLVKPSRRNEGTAEQNIRAAIRYLSRKGFGSSGAPAARRPQGFFDGWPTALTRYNGRRDRTETDRYYSDEYSDKIVRRALDPETFVPIEIKLKK